MLSSCATGSIAASGSIWICGGGCCSRTGGCANTLLNVAPSRDSEIKSSSAASELIMVTANRSPNFPSTTAPKRICVCSFTWRPSSCMRTSTSESVIPAPPDTWTRTFVASASIRPRSINGFLSACVRASCARLSESDSPKPNKHRPLRTRNAASKSSKPMRISPGRWIRFTTDRTLWLIVVSAIANA